MQNNIVLLNDMRKPAFTTAIVFLSYYLNVHMTNNETIHFGLKEKAQREFEGGRINYISNYSNGQYLITNSKGIIIFSQEGQCK